MENRIQKLEAAIRSQRKCEVCGLRPDEGGYLVVSWPAWDIRLSRQRPI